MAAPNNRVGRLYELQREHEGKTPETYVWTAAVKIPPPTKDQMKELRAEGADTNQIIFGKHCDEILKYYGSRPAHEWDDFITDINERFFGPSVGDGEGKSPSENSSDS